MVCSASDWTALNDKKITENFTLTFEKSGSKISSTLYLNKIQILRREQVGANDCFQRVVGWCEAAAVLF